MTLIDLHTHSRPYSGDSTLTTAELVQRAFDEGLGGVCLTEHDTMAPAEEARALSERYGILVLRGMEVTTDIGHVLVYGLDAYSPDLRSVETLRRQADRAGAAIFLAHPYRGWHRPIDWERLPSLVHGVEALNGQEHSSRNDQALLLAADFNCPGTGGSDTHFVSGIAVCATRFSERPTNDRELAEALLAGLHEPVQLRIPAWSRKPIPPF